MGTVLQNRWVGLPAATLPPVLITTSSLPSASSGAPYSQTLAATGGQAPYTWTLLSAVPNTGSWLHLSPGGVLSGTPATGELEVILVQAQDSLGTKASAFFAFFVTAPLVITTSSLPSGSVGVPYSTTVTATGGIPPYTWAVLSDTPDTGSWLSINPTTGVLSGTPGTAETETVTVQVTDSVGTHTPSAPLNLVIAGPAVGYAYPLVGTAADGGDQSYGQATTTGFTSYSAAAPGTPAYIACQQLGANDIVFALNGSFEGWGTSASGRTKTDLVNTVKGKGTFPNLKNTARTPYVFLYANMESQLVTGSGYQTYVNLVIANNWWLYETTGGTGTKVPSAASGTGYFNVNYSYAWPTAAGTVPVTFTICGNAYGTQSNSQGPARTAAQYFATALLTTNRTLDTRFSALPVNGAAPNADGVFLDNCFTYPNAGGNLVSSASWDGQNIQASGTIAVYPTGASSLMADGQTQFFATFQAYLASCNPGSTYINCINGGSYANITANGDTHTATGSAMDGVAGAMYLEAVAGVSGSSWQTYQTPTEVMANIAAAVGYLQAPKLVGVGIRMPATDGSLTSFFVTGGVGQTVTATSGQPPTALECQMWRCMAAISYMQFASVHACPGVSGYNYALTRWYDESGDDSLVQVNVKRGWLGQPSGVYVTLSNGVLARQFANGVVLFNGWGNGAQTVTAAMLTNAFAQSYQFITGTQQPTINSGAVFASYALKDADGLFLKTVVVPTLSITTSSPLSSATTGTLYSTTVAATGGVTPYTWSIVSDTPDTGSWISINPSTGVLSGTPGTAETETVVVKVTDARNVAANKTFTLVVNASGGIGTPALFQNFDSLTVGSSPPFSGIGTAIVDNAQSFSPPNSMRCDTTKGSFDLGISSCITQTVGVGAEVWHRFRIFFPLGFNFTAKGGGSATALKFFRIDTGTSPAGHGSHIDWYLFDGNATGVGTFDWIYEGAGSGPSAWAFGGGGNTPIPSQIVRGQWITMERYEFLGSTAASAISRLWINGTLVCDTSANIPNGVPRHINLVAGNVIGPTSQGAQGFAFCTYVNGASPATQSCWIDSWAIYTTVTTGPPTAIDAHGNVFIGTGAPS